MSASAGSHSAVRQQRKSNYAQLVEEEHDQEDTAYVIDDEYSGIHDLQDDHDADHGSHQNGTSGKHRHSHQRSADFHLLAAHDSAPGTPAGRANGRSHHLQDIDLVEEAVDHETIHVEPYAQRLVNQPISHSDITVDSAVHVSSAEDESTFEECQRVREMIGYRSRTYKLMLYYLVGMLTGGLTLLLGYWLPLRAVRYYADRVDNLASADFVLVIAQSGGFEFCYIEPLTTSPEVEREYQYGLFRRPVDLQAGDRIDLNRHMITFRHQRFIYQPSDQRFHRVSRVITISASALHQRLATGLSADAHNQALLTYGFNSLNLVVSSIPSLLVTEVLHPFFIFQCYSVALWMVEEYYVFAVALGGIATYAIVTTLVETRKRLQSLSKLARHEMSVHVLRDGAEQTVSSSQLVPGDIMRLTADVLPCDVVLLSGSAVVNEAMLTGESVPVIKSAITIPRPSSSRKHAEASINLGDVDARSTLYSATRIMQLKPASDSSPVLGIATRTGFQTTKGALIVSMLYPKPSNFKFVQASYKFVGMMFCISLVGFAVSVWQLGRQGAPTETIIIRALDLITIVVPPSLPLAMTVGVNVAIHSLKKQQLFCISPQKTNVAGKIRTMCFDKTGTLTTDGMELLGVLPAKRGSFDTQLQGPLQSTSYQRAHADPHTIDIPGHDHRHDAQLHDHSAHAASDEVQLTALPNIMDEANHMLGRRQDSTNGRSALLENDSMKAERAYSDAMNGHDANDSDASLLTASRPLSADVLPSMACCHGLATLSNDASAAKDVSSAQQLIGDPLEVKIFEATAATLNDSHQLPDGCLALITLPSVHGSKAGQQYAIRQRFEFEASLQRMSVIAVDSNTRNTMAYVKGSPEMIESLCIRSTLPDNFSDMLTKYSSHGYRVLATAEKPLDATLAQPHSDLEQWRRDIESNLTFTGFIVMENAVKPETAPTIHVLQHDAQIRCVLVSGDNALTCISVAKQCQLVEPGTQIFLAHLVSDDVKGGGGSQSLEWIDTENPDSKLDPHTLLYPAEEEVHGQRYELALTGKTFDWLLHRSPDRHLPTSLLNRVCLSTQICARFTPEQKQQFVQRLQDLDIYTGMCGDGANDTSALKQAHVGVSLSTTEASIAAPFTSTQPNISCIPVLLREGRSSLVTSFQLFRYMACYSIIQFTAVILCYFRGSVLSNWQYLYQDMFVVFPLTLFIGYTPASSRLGVKRPSGNLLSVYNVLNIGCHFLICFLYQLLVFLITDQANGYVDYSRLPGFGHDSHTWEATSLYQFSNFSYVFMAFFLSVGRPWKKHSHYNRKLFIWLLICVTISTLMLFIPDWALFQRDDISDLPLSWRATLLGLVLANFLTSGLFEVSVSPRLLRFYKRHLRAKSASADYGYVYHRRKLIRGSRAKLYHQLRGEFEASFDLLQHRSNQIVDSAEDSAPI